MASAARHERALLARRDRAQERRAESAPPDLPPYNVLCHLVSWQDVVGRRYVETGDACRFYVIMRQGSPAATAADNDFPEPDELVALAPLGLDANVVATATARRDVAASSTQSPAMQALFGKRPGSATAAVASAAQMPFSVRARVDSVFWEPRRAVALVTWREAPRALLQRDYGVVAHRDGVPRYDDSRA